MEASDLESSTLTYPRTVHPPKDQASQCYIDSLPSELICKVFKILKEQGPEHITPCLAVSKQWHVYGQRIMWSSLALDEITYDNFAYSLAFGGSSYRGLLNLTVKFQNAFEMRCSCLRDWETEFHCKMSDLSSRWIFHRIEQETICSDWYHVDVHEERRVLQENHRYKLKQMLVSMRYAIASGLRNLSTLSLTIKNEPTDGDYCYCHECILSPRFFASIIKALPETCTDLELDTGGADKAHIDKAYIADPSCEDHDTLCEALHDILPQLQHLRLRVAAICPDFIYGPHLCLPLNLEPSACQMWAEVCEVDLPHWCYSTTEPIGVGPCFYGPTGDLWNWQQWNDLEESEKQVWQMIHDIQKTYTPSKLPMKPLPNLQSCIINLCPFPHTPGTCLHLDDKVAGLQAATVLALQIHRAWKHWKTMPALKICRIISSDWEPDDLELYDECNNFFCHEWIADLSYGIVRELITHDVVASQTRITPFRRTQYPEGATGAESERGKLSSPRTQPYYECRSDEDEVYLVSLEELEPYIEGCWLPCADGTRRPSVPAAYAQLKPKRVVAQPKYPYHHLEKYDGLLDRAQVRERRIEVGEDWRFNTLLYTCPYTCCDDPDEERNERKMDRRARLALLDQKYLDDFPSA